MLNLVNSYCFCNQVGVDLINVAPSDLVQVKHKSMLLSCATKQVCLNLVLNEIHRSDQLLFSISLKSTCSQHKVLRKRVTNSRGAKFVAIISTTKNALFS